ncbi:hypothetical protein [Halarchaeum nitratireducens]|uniref:Uncharacterized protein n=1 Tax=Halarchaeum nitratireducens TaxID=489913 RepID=A0A830GHP7_9EURY|nr:hypothetical protein [Halarchaeum nitratireducens]GGN26994.1 hypothetical protein GCM10009021_31890 [Halarchaeum nitratireducens]
MPSMKRFWAGVGRRSRCLQCGYRGEPDQSPHRDDTPKLTLRRAGYESRGEFECAQCGAEGTYLRRGRSQADLTTGALETDGVDHREQH